MHTWKDVYTYIRMCMCVHTYTYIYNHTIYIYIYYQQSPPAGSSWPGGLRVVPHQPTMCSWRLLGDGKLGLTCWGT